MIVLIFGGQAMFFEEEFNIITTEDYDKDEKPTNKMRKDIACFLTFMLMNIFNMINCRVVDENQDNVFKTIFNNGLFWIIFLLELAVTYAMVLSGEIPTGNTF